MAFLSAVLLLFAAWSLQPTTSTQSHHVERYFLNRIARSAAAAIETHPRGPHSSTELTLDDLPTLFNATPSTLNQSAFHLPNLDAIELKEQTAVTLDEGYFSEPVTLTKTLMTSTPLPVTLSSEASQNDTAGGTSEDYYYLDYETETAVYDEATTISSQVTSDDKTLEMSTSDKLDSSQMTHSFVAVSNSSRTSGRALTTHNDLELQWEARSTKVTSTFADVPDVTNTEELATGVILAITLSMLVVLIAAGGGGYWWYRRRYTNRPETLNDRYAASETGNSGGDDIFRVGYIHHPELPKDSSEEMYSLDNDSFLTSLEAMTIPNYWTENIKHTKL